MKNNETGEFELVLGNRQLLSGFFIVILLLAVTFAMGYVVGQNSPRSARAQETAGPVPAASSEGRPQPVPAPAAPPPSADAAAGASSGPGDSPAQPTTQPARDSAAGVPSAGAPQAPERAGEQPSENPSGAGTSSAVVSEAPPGSYWQVMAVNQPAAEAVLKTLRDNGFPTLLTPGPNNLVRVLVGPYSDVPTMSKAKTDLEKLGLHPVRK
jgi:hypothetical protein